MIQECQWLILVIPKVNGWNRWLYLQQCDGVVGCWPADELWVNLHCKISEVVESTSIFCISPAVIGHCITFSFFYLVSVFQLSSHTYTPLTSLKASSALVWKEKTFLWNLNTVSPVSEPAAFEEDVTATNCLYLTWLCTPVKKKLFITKHTTVAVSSWA